MIRLKIGLVVLGFVTGLTVGTQVAHADSLGNLLHAKSADGTLSQAEFKRCLLAGDTWRAAVNARDEGLTRMQAYDRADGYTDAAGLPSDYTVDTVRAVYSNPAFAGVDAKALGDDVAADCLDPGHRYDR